MAIVNKIDALLERAYTEGDRRLNQAYGELLVARKHWGEICSVMPTNSERVDLSLLLDVPKYAEEIGGVAFSDLKAKNFIITPRKFSGGIKMYEDDVDDDMMGILLDRIGDLAQAPQDAFCEHTFKCLKAGISIGDYGACYDGLAFFHAAHVVGATTFSNYVAGGGATPWYLLDCSKSTKPLVMAARKSPKFEMLSRSSSHTFKTGELLWKVQGRMWVSYGLWQRAYCSAAPLTDDVIWDGIEAMRGFQDENGRFISSGPTHLCVAPDTEQTAREILERTKIGDSVAGVVTDYVGGVDNAPINGLNLKLIVDPYLA